jgi:transcriptional regulator with XRE-family HTH domain
MVMAVFEGWTFAAARGASRKSLLQIAEASKISPGVLEQIEQARDIELTGSRFDLAAVERLIDTHGALGFRIPPRTLFRAAAVKRVQ